MSLKKHIEKFDELHSEYVENTNYTDKLFAPVEELKIVFTIEMGLLKI